MSAREIKLVVERENALGWFRASERKRIALLSENARLREALELAQNLVPPVFNPARELIAAALYRAPTNERNEADMSTHNVQVKTTGITCDEPASLSQPSTVEGSDKLGTNSEPEPHRNHSQPHSGTIEPRVSVTPRVIPVLTGDPDADARIDALVAAQPKPEKRQHTSGELVSDEQTRRMLERLMDPARIRADALEEAAKLLEGTDGWPSPQGKSIAAAIRALKDGAT